MKYEIVKTQGTKTSVGAFMMFDEQGNEGFDSDGNNAWDTLEEAKKAKAHAEKMKTYNFEVPAFYRYEIEANSEEEARSILEDKGGIDIDGELCELDYRDYQNAKLIEDNS